MSSAPYTFWAIVRILSTMGIYGNGHAIQSSLVSAQLRRDIRQEGVMTVRRTLLCVLVGFDHQTIDNDKTMTKPQ